MVPNELISIFWYHFAWPPSSPSPGEETRFLTPSLLAVFLQKYFVVAEWLPRLNVWQI